jgi:hypothetical protein
MDQLVEGVNRWIKTQDLPFELNTPLKNKVASFVDDTAGDTEAAFNIQSEDFDAEQKTFIKIFGPGTPYAFLPDSGTKLFTAVKDHTPLLDNILLFLQKNAEGKKIYTISYSDSDITFTKYFNDKITYPKTIKPKINDLFFFEYFQGNEFGHFAAGYLTLLDGKKMLILYESMSLPDREINSYIETFTDIFQKNVMEVDGVYADMYRGQGAYSMEVTGGTPDVFNTYLHGICSEEKVFGFHAMYDMFGVDNQNQFCYMWAIVYLWCCVFNGYAFDELQQRICEQQMIPVVFIKSFIYYMLLFFRQEDIVITSDMEFLLKSEYFIKHFYQITSNALTYGPEGTFNCTNSIYSLYDISFQIVDKLLTPNTLIYYALQSTLIDGHVLLWKDPI